MKAIFRNISFCCHLLRLDEVPSIDEGDHVVSVIPRHLDLAILSFCHGASLLSRQ